MNNDAYAAALAEIEDGRLDKGAWARAFAESGGDESKAKALYIKARAESIDGSPAWPDTQPPIEDVPQKRVAPGNGKDTPDNQPVDFYKAAIGEKNLDYYIGKFHAFDEKGPGLHPSWNWSAFLFTTLWALYRKMYGWFFAWWAVGTTLTVFLKVQNSEINQILGIVVGAIWIAFTLYANAFYHRKIKARIDAAQNGNSNAALVNSRLSSGAGVNAWAAYVFGVVPVLVIVAAVALPAYQDYSKRAALAATPVHAPAPQETSGKYGENDTLVSPAPPVDWSQFTQTKEPSGGGTTTAESAGQNGGPNTLSYEAVEYNKAFLAFQRSDYEATVKIIVPLAYRGDASSQSLLGAMYSDGLGVHKDYTEAVRWYRLAAANGDGTAQTNLGSMYFDGRGVERNYREAATWYRLAAEQGGWYAQGLLGEAYESGIGVTKDVVRAHMWMNLAIASGNTKQREARNILEGSMSPQQIAQAQQMASDCKQRNFKGCD